MNPRLACPSCDTVNLEPLAVRSLETVREAVAQINIHDCPSTGKVQLDMPSGEIRHWTLRAPC